MKAAAAVSEGPVITTNGIQTNTTTSNISFVKPNGNKQSNSAGNSTSQKSGEYPLTRLYNYIKSFFSKTDTESNTNIKHHWYWPYQTTFKIMTTKAGNENLENKVDSINGIFRNMGLNILSKMVKVQILQKATKALYSILQTIHDAIKTSGSAAHLKRSFLNNFACFALVSIVFTLFDGWIRKMRNDFYNSVHKTIQKNIFPETEEDCNKAGNIKSVFVKTQNKGLNQTAEIGKNFSESTQAMFMVFVELGVYTMLLGPTLMSTVLAILSVSGFIQYGLQTKFNKAQNIRNGNTFQNDDVTTLMKIVHNHQRDNSGVERKSHAIHESSVIERSIGNLLNLTESITLCIASIAYFYFGGQAILIGSIDYAGFCSQFPMFLEATRVTSNYIKQLMNHFKFQNLMEKNVTVMNPNAIEAIKIDNHERPISHRSFNAVYWAALVTIAIALLATNATISGQVLYYGTLLSNYSPALSAFAETIYTTAVNAAASLSDTSLVLYSLLGTMMMSMLAQYLMPSNNIKEYGDNKLSWVIFALVSVTGLLFFEPAMQFVLAQEGLVLSFVTPLIIGSCYLLDSCVYTQISMGIRIAKIFISQEIVRIMHSPVNVASSVVEYTKSACINSARFAQSTLSGVANSSCNMIKSLSPIRF